MQKSNYMKRLFTGFYIYFLLFKAALNSYIAIHSKSTVFEQVGFTDKRVNF